MINRPWVIISWLGMCVQGRGPRRSLMSTWFSARAPASHFASTVRKPHDQPRLHRCNPRTTHPPGVPLLRSAAMEEPALLPYHHRQVTLPMAAETLPRPTRHEPRRTSTASMGHVERLISSPDACEMMPHHGACEVDRSHPVWRPRWEAHRRPCDPHTHGGVTARACPQGAWGSSWWVGRPTQLTARLQPRGGALGGARGVGVPGSWARSLLGAKGHP